MNASVDDVEITSLREEVDRLLREVEARNVRIGELESARATAIVYAKKLAFLCSTLTEESVDLDIVVNAIQNVLKDV